MGGGVGIYKIYLCEMNFFFLKQLGIIGFVLAYGRVIWVGCGRERQDFGI